MDEQIPRKCPGIFERIYSGQIPARIAYKNDVHGIAVAMDVMPVGKGHLLTFPLACIESVDDLPSELRNKVYTVSTYAGRILKRAFGSEYGYIGQLVAGNQVPHAHVHRVPGDADADWMKRFGKVDGFGRLDPNMLPMDEILEELTSQSSAEVWRACDQELDAMGAPDPLTLQAIQALESETTR